MRSLALLHTGFLAALAVVLSMTMGISHADEKWNNIWKPDMSVITEPADEGYVRIRDTRTGYMHVENGSLQTGSIQDAWHSAQWKQEVEGDFVRFQNRWKPEVYLHVETGTVDAGTISPGWLSAQWKSGGAAMTDRGLKSRAKFKCKDPGDDGCSNPLKDAISAQLKEVFKPACEVHDRCYASPWRLSGQAGYQGQRSCDQEFEENMSAICKTLGAVSQADCWIGKTAFHLTVQDWGLEAFDNGQKKAESSCYDQSARVDNGAIRFFNSGGYVAEVAMSYMHNGQLVSKKEDIALAKWVEWNIPVGSTSIAITAHSYTGLVWDPKKVIFVETWDKPQSKCFKLYNTTLDPKYNNNCQPL